MVTCANHSRNALSWNSVQRILTTFQDVNSMTLCEMIFYPSTPDFYEVTIFENTYATDEVYF